MGQLKKSSRGRIGALNKKRPAPDAWGAATTKGLSNAKYPNLPVTIGLLADAQPFNDLLVAFRIPSFQIFQQALPLTHHNQQAAP